MNNERKLDFGREASLAGASCPESLNRWIENLPDDLVEILNRIAETGHGAWAVGGCVRDALLGAHSGDIDLCSTCTPEEVMNLFGEQAIPTGIEFGTVTIKGASQHYELTTLRSEGMYRDGRRPDQVAWGTSLKEDLSRRDFTFNAMALDVARRILYDPFNGTKDMENRLVRAVGDPMQRCDEDGLRIFRAYRFLDRGQLGLWHLESTLHQAMQSKQPILTKVAIERKWTEFQKIMNGRHAADVLALMIHDGTIQHILPSLRFVRPELLDLFGKHFDESWLLKHRLGFLLVEFGPSEVKRSLGALKLPKSLLNQTLQFHRDLGTIPEPRTSSLRVFRYCLGEDANIHLRLQHLLVEISALVHGREPSKGSMTEVAVKWASLGPQHAPSESLVDGHWIMKRTGVEQGVRLGRLKNWLHRIQIENDITEVDAIELHLSRIPWQHGEPLEWPQLQFP
ncbi:hypothetical protein [Poseidonia sp.]|uniref:hypothetical protein n=1 Tax=Poseidonia sp. TaxID=2666344 RepID=UPI003F6A0EFE